MRDYAWIFLVALGILLGSVAFVMTDRCRTEKMQIREQSNSIEAVDSMNEQTNEENLEGMKETMEGSFPIADDSEKSEDTIPPVIEGVRDREIMAGDTIAYRDGIIVSDNMTENPVLTIEADQVNLKKAGTYQVMYRATDDALNETVQMMHVTVLDRGVDLEEMDAMADEILEKILTKDMDPMTKLRKIYDWVRQNMGYCAQPAKDDWMKGAYEGLKNRTGDCYIYFAVTKELLTRAGIENRDIAKVKENSNHYWNLVNIGDGWYHFDTTPRNSKGEFFMLTNEQILEYSSHHMNSHAYDENLYQDVEWGMNPYHDFDPTYHKPQEDEAMEERE